MDEKTTTYLIRLAELDRIGVDIYDESDAVTAYQKGVRDCRRAFRRIYLEDNKKAAPGAANTSDGKENTLHPQYTTQVMEVQVGKTLPDDVKCILSEFFGGRG